MKVYIIGAGPGDPDLITVKGCKLVETCPIVFYTGSLVPKAVIERAKDDALVLDSSGMDLDEIMEVFKKAKKENKANTNKKITSVFKLKKLFFFISILKCFKKFILFYLLELK